MGAETNQALRTVVRQLLRERESLRNVIDALFTRLQQEREAQERIYNLAYTQGLRNGRRKRND